jgi:hypothetical protein
MRSGSDVLRSLLLFIVRACASAASDAIAQSSVSSGEKKELNRKGGTNALSLPASSTNEARAWY